MLSVWRRYRDAGDRLLALPFVTITDYLFELRAISRIMHRLGPNGLLYLAAAVSDFFLPVCDPSVALSGVFNRICFSFGIHKLIMGSLNGWQNIKFRAPISIQTNWAASHLVALLQTKTKRLLTTLIRK